MSSNLSRKIAAIEGPITLTGCCLKVNFAGITGLLSGALATAVVAYGAAGRLLGLHEIERLWKLF